MKRELTVPRTAPKQGTWTKKQREEFRDVKEDILTAVMQAADEREWSNTKLAKESNLSPTCVNNIFHGRTLNPSLGSVLKMALSCDLRVTVIEARLKIKRRGVGAKLSLRKAS